MRPEFWDSESVGRCPIPARLMFIGLWTLCDDYGRMKYSPTLIRARVFAWDADVSDQDIRDWVGKLREEGMVRVYQLANDPHTYLEVCNFNRYQKPNRKYASEIPAPDGSVPPPPEPAAAPRNAGGAAFKPPTIEEVVAAGEMDGVPKDQCEAFWRHYESTGWRGFHSWRPRLKNWAEDKRSARAPSPIAQQVQDSKRLDFLRDEVKRIADVIRTNGPNDPRRAELIAQRKGVLAEIAKLEAKLGAKEGGEA